MKRNKILFIVGFFITIFSFFSNAETPHTTTFSTVNISERQTSDYIKEINIQSTVEGFDISWHLDYERYQELKEEEFFVCIRYELDGVEDESNGSFVKEINLQRTKYSLKGLSGGKTYSIELGLKNKEYEFWTDKQHYTTEKGWGLFRFLVLIGSLGMFIYGMKIMSEGLQRAAGSRLRYLLGSITSNRLKGILTGFGITALVQSSSVTTVMTVSFVNAGLLTLAQSVGVMMGANIGTTVTGWIVNFFGFEVDLGPYSLVLIGLALPMLFLANPKIKAWATTIIGFSLLFMGLGFLNDSVPTIDEDSSLVRFIVGFNETPYISILLFAFFGLILTVIIQSSSAALALTMTLVASGILPFDIAAAMVIGQNLGTTITAELAATIGNVHAKRAARINTLFNFIGGIGAIIAFPFLLNGVKLIMDIFHLGNPFENPKIYGNTGLAILHTLFNVITVLILIWFVPNLVRIAEKMVKPKGAKDEEFHLDYIGSGYMATPNLSLLEAKKEIAKFGELTSRMSEFARELLFEGNKKNQKKLIERISKYEEITDRVEVEVANYLNKISEGGADPNIAIRIRGMNSITNDLERIGDIFYQIAKSIEKKEEEKIRFTAKQRNRLKELFNLIDEAFKVMCENLTKHASDVELDEANRLEDLINKKRDEIRSEHLESLFKGEELKMQAGIIYSSIFQSLERVGDHIINVSEGVVGKI